MPDPVTLLVAFNIAELTALYIAKKGIRCIDCKKRWCDAQQKIVMNARFSIPLCDTCYNTRIYKKIF